METVDINNQKQEKRSKTIRNVFKEVGQKERGTEEMIAEKVFAEGVAKDIRNYLPPEYENADFQVVQKNKNNGVQLIGVQVNLPGKDLSPIIYVEQFFDEIRQGEPVERVMNRIASCIEEIEQGSIYE